MAQRSTLKYDIEFPPMSIITFEIDFAFLAKDRDGNTPLAWARETNAEEVIHELEKHGGIADEEWHGEKPKLIDPEDETEEDQELHGIDNNQFEIEENGDNGLISLDALQRQN